MRPRDARSRPRPPLAAAPPPLVPVPAPTVRDQLEAALADGTWNASYIRDLTRKVGGVDALARLDAAPLPDEALDWSAVDERDRDFVAKVLLAADSYCNDMLDTEYRTIARRILAIVATRDPTPLRRGSTTTCAAGLVWLTLRANWGVGRHTRITASMIWWWFGVSPCADRGLGLRKAAGLVPPDERDADEASRDKDLWLGSAELVHSRVRRSLVEQRTRALESAAATRARREAQRPFSHRGNGQVEVRAQLTTPLLAFKGMTEEGRATVIVGFGESDDDASVFALSVPDAHDLVSKLQRALAMPIPQRSQ